MIEQLSAWVYPGPPCIYEDKDFQPEQYRGLHALANEYLCFTNDVQPDGTYIKTRPVKEVGAGGYSKNNVKKLIKSIPEPYCTLSGKSSTGVSTMLQNNKQQQCINKIIKFCTTNSLNLDLNIEGLADFTKKECKQHATFIDDLGKACKDTGITYRVVTVAENGKLYHGNWRNNLLKDVTCDYIVMMNYDYHFDYENSSCTPHEWLKAVINYTKSWMSENDFKNKYICGLPNYGFQTNIDSWWPIEIRTANQFKDMGIKFNPLVRAKDSGELIADDGKHIYYLNDSKALEQNTLIAMQLGCTRFCIWHILSNNAWYSDEFLDKHLYNDAIDPNHTETSEDYKEIGVKTEQTETFKLNISGKKEEIQKMIKLIETLKGSTVKISVSK
jgi:hypothetical protein